MRGSGPLRVLCVGLLGAGIVVGGQQVDRTVDVTRAADDRGRNLAVRSVNTEWMCPGPVRPTGTPAPVQVLAAADPGTGSGSGSLRAAGLPGGVNVNALDGQDNSTSSVTAASGILLTGTGSRATGVAVDQFAVDTGTGSRGMRLTTCTTPVNDAWLLAGAGEAGRVPQVVLVNPGDEAVSVDLDVSDTTGRAAGASRSAVLVPARGREVIALDTSGSRYADVAIHVIARGGAVAAWAQDTWYSGDTPVGSSLASATQDADTTALLPGVGVGAGPTTVRVAVPGVDDAVVRVRAVAADGHTAFDDSVSVPAGAAGHLALASLPAGVYAVQVSSDVPVVAAALSRTNATGAGDMSWMAAATPVTELTGAAIPAGRSSRLVLSGSSGPATVSLVTTGAGGGTRRVQVRATAPTVIDLSAAQSVFVRVDKGSVAAGLLIESNDSTGPLSAATALGPLPVRADITDISAGN